MEKSWFFNSASNNRRVRSSYPSDPANCTRIWQRVTELSSSSVSLRSAKTENQRHDRTVRTWRRTKLSRRQEDLICDTYHFCSNKKSDRSAEQHWSPSICRMCGGGFVSPLPSEIQMNEVNNRPDRAAVIEVCRCCSLEHRIRLFWLSRRRSVHESLF